MAVLIDTSVIVGLERRGLALADLARIGASDAVVAVASMTASELLVGIHRAAPSSRRTNRLAFVERILTDLRVVPFDLPAARTHARIWTDLAAQGTPIGPNDLVIAATALAHGFDVLTDNPREFTRIAGLVVRQPGWPT